MASTTPSTATTAGTAAKELHVAAEKGFTSEAIALYESGRPEFSEDSVARLLRETQVLAAGQTRPSRAVKILEVGAGSGKFTRQLAKFVGGENITAVEPTGLSDHIAATQPDVTLVNTVADKLPFEDASFDAIYVAQAFHWFATHETLKEFHRVLKPKGFLGLVWNIRVAAKTGWLRKLEDMINSYYPPNTPRQQHKMWKHVFAEDTAPQPVPVLVVDADGKATEVKDAAAAAAADVLSIPTVPPEGATLTPSPYFGMLHTGYEVMHNHGGTDMVTDHVASMSVVSQLPQEGRQAVHKEVLEMLATHPDTKGKEKLTMPFCVELYWSQRLDLDEA